MPGGVARLSLLGQLERGSGLGPRGHVCLQPAPWGPRVPGSAVGAGTMDLFAVLIMVFHALSSEAL